MSLAETDIKLVSLMQYKQLADEVGVGRHGSKAAIANRIQPEVPLRGLACGAPAPQANGDGEMLAGNRGDVDSGRQRQRIVAPPPGRRWGSSGRTRSRSLESQPTNPAPGA